MPDQLSGVMWAHTIARGRVNRLNSHRITLTALAAARSRWCSTHMEACPQDTQNLVQSAAPHQQATTICSRHNSLRNREHSPFKTAG
ncbi:hypothetical protein GCM10010211_15350 [Streptomyces albospinus]|uniref:Transposase n=1 Tax=Streptomyces albospinus TaxID=285515 RepID=A0ABQ2UWJ8_9ACTN|nr:hypothetical protein GCM10010211_15350 [Streptomyces albospinus]